MPARSQKEAPALAVLSAELARVKDVSSGRFAYVEAELRRLRADVPDLAERAIQPVHDRIDRLRAPDDKRLADQLADRLAGLEETVRQLRRELAEQDQRSRDALDATDQLVRALAGR